MHHHPREGTTDAIEVGDEAPLATVLDLLNGGVGLLEGGVDRHGGIEAILVEGTETDGQTVKVLSAGKSNRSVPF